MVTEIKKTARTALDSARLFRYHQYHRRVALRILRAIEASKGKTSHRDIRRSDEYAVDVLGGQCYAPWLYVYSAIAGEFKEGWIPDNYYGSVVMPILKGDYGRISRLKPLNFTVFRSDVFPDLLSYVNGVFFDTQGRVISADEVKDVLFSEYERVVFKLDNSLQGRGIYVFDSHSFNIERVRRLGNGLFQAFIEQHNDFYEFGSRAVATLRMTTVTDEMGGVSLRASYLRLGLSGETHVQSRTNIKVAVDTETGDLADVGYTAQWLETPVHPSSKVEFMGKTIPKFDECRRVVTELHTKIPYVRCIGWDVTVDAEEKVRIMEWNGTHNDIKFSEATQGPCFADLGWERLGKLSGRTAPF